jgi:hypothetical protein
VSAETQLELLGLIDAATSAGWPHVRACSVLELADVRAHRWRARLREPAAWKTARRSVRRCTVCWPGKSRRSSS